MTKILKKFDKKIRIYTALTLLITVILVRLFVIQNYHKDDIDQSITEKQRTSVTRFSNVIHMVKECNLLPYPEITILSDVDWKVSSLNISEWEYIKKWKILMQINNDSNEYTEKLNDVQLSIDELQIEYENMKSEYDQSDLIYSQQIEELNNEISYTEDLLAESVFQYDGEWQQIRENKIEEIENQIANIQVEQWIKHQDFIVKINRIENEIISKRNEYETYYNKINQLTPRATIDWTVWEIYISQWDLIHNGDLLLTIIKSDEDPKFSVELDFDEYILTQNLSEVIVVLNLENEWQYSIQQYSWTIFTRNPAINENNKYEVTVQIPDFSWTNIRDVDSMSIIFPIESKWLRINESCINYSWNNSAFINLYDWIREWTQDVTILTHLDNQVLIDDGQLFIQSNDDSTLNNLEESGLNSQEIDSWIENDILDLFDSYQNLQILCEN